MFSPVYLVICINCIITFDTVNLLIWMEMQSWIIKIIQNFVLGNVKLKEIIKKNNEDNFFLNRTC